MAGFRRTEVGRARLPGGRFRAVGWCAMRQRLAGRSVVRRNLHPPPCLLERFHTEELQQTRSGPVDQGTPLTSSIRRRVAMPSEIAMARTSARSWVSRGSCWGWSRWATAP
jgi:hypothetical protein